MRNFKLRHAYDRELDDLRSYVRLSRFGWKVLKRSAEVVRNLGEAVEIDCFECRSGTCGSVVSVSWWWAAIWIELT